MIDDVKRRAGPFSTEGQSGFPFTFAVFKATDVAVLLASSSDDLNPDTLVYGTDYTVELNDDQNAAPGGTVTLTTPLAAGATLSIVSAVPYTQPTQLTNYSRFPPEILNKSLDRLEVQIQQLREGLDRTVKVSSTSTITADELRSAILNVSAHAEEWAKTSAESAAQAQALADEMKEKLSTLDDLTDEEKAKIIAETENQLERIKAAADGTLTEDGVSCNEIDWDIESDIAAETTVTFPQNFSYIAGRHHLLLWYDGVELTKDENFSEVGNEDQRSYTFIPHFPLAAGSHMHAWTAALGRGDETQLYSELYDLRSALADLSSRVVYKSEQAADDSSSSSSTSGS